jgi:hypothetical protein
MTNDVNYTVFILILTTDNSHSHGPWPCRHAGASVCTLQKITAVRGHGYSYRQYGKCAIGAACMIMAALFL